jgi:hypothetical protein
MRYNKWEQRQLDQQSGAELDERQKELVAAIARLLEHGDSRELDQWEREQYNLLKLEQEVKDVPSG